MKKVYISDLDGTLLKNDASIGEECASKLKTLLESGLCFTVATARSVNGVKKILKNIPLSLPVIEQNGALLTDYLTGKHLLVNAMQSETAFRVFEVFRRCNAFPFISAAQQDKNTLFYAELVNPGMQWYADEKILQDDPRLTRLTNVATVFYQQVISYVLLDSFDKCTSIVNEINDCISDPLQIHLAEHSYRRGWFELTIQDLGARKANAIEELIRIYNLTNHELVVFGDHINDIDMLKLASRPVVVANAHVSLMEYAAEVIGSNEGGSVVKYIAEDFMKSKPT